ncbi:MAG: protein kinase [Lachnospiraceae bacterium]|nr:protein kinase [Lachnospiraceae bacterium]
MNVNQICMSCMSELKGQAICPNCQTEDSSNKNQSRHLPIRTILRGKYLVGKVLGEGGFGITYIGYDLDLQIRVAIKEFCPRSYAGREVTDQITLLPFDEKAEEIFEAEKEKFINEARRLAKFRDEDGVVSVLDYFKENGTAYIVMEYIDGVTLKNYLKTLDEKIKIQDVLTLLQPIMVALNMMHKENLIHRDISPDNIMIRKDLKKVYLIDFGNARDVHGEHSMSIYKKGSYTPIEQQSRHGKQGSWTDVYSLCATIYYCITGRNIPEAADRIIEDNLIAPSKMGVEVPQKVEEVLLKGLVINPNQRIQTMEELMEELYQDNPEEKKITDITSVTENTEEKIEIIIKNQDESKEDDMKDSVEDGRIEAKKTSENKIWRWLIGLGILFLCGYWLIWSDANKTTVVSLEDGGTRECVYKDGGIVSQKDYYPNGELKSHIYMEDGNKYEVYYRRDESGKLLGTFNHVNDVLLDETWYRENGHIVYYVFKDGDENNYTGVERNESGKIVFKLVVEDGSNSSSVRYDYPKEGWEMHIAYIENKHCYIYYDEYAKLIASTTYVDDVYVGGEIYDETKWNSIDWEKADEDWESRAN